MQKIYDQHDIVCNQKYGKYLPYSFHLKAVESQADKYIVILYPFFTELPTLVKLVKISAAGHDLIEDARMTYNDVIDMIEKEGFTHENAKFCADVIYACTEVRGHTREERHSQEYFDTLKTNRVAVYVKLCDIIANVLFSLLTNSSMTAKYRAEFPRLEKELRVKDEYDILWNDLEKLLRLE